MKRAVVAAAVLLTARVAGATGFTDIGQDIVPRDKVDVQLDGYMRTRGEMLYNLDLDRGLTPSGKPLFPVSLSDPNAQTLTYWDSRLRTDVAVYAPGGTVAVKTRIDVLDDIALGSAPEGIPAASASQASDGSRILRVKRAYGEALTPIGLLAAGRMGNAWGLGILANGGDCPDCDSGDAADRIALLSPIAGHIWALAYDFSATEVFAPRQDGIRYVNLEPTTDVRTITFAMLRYRDDLSRMRRRRAGKTTFDYGAYLSHRWQNGDVPASYLPTAQPIPITAAQVMARGYQATALDGWARLDLPSFHVEAEIAYLLASVDQPSLVPGVLYHVPVTSHQLGAAVESELADPGGKLGAGLDFGYASGDPSPGFGAFPQTGATPARPGDLDGPKADPPLHTTVDNFRFHPDYRIDQILFREIIGAVTGATYARPHARWRITEMGPGAVTLRVAGVASWAIYAESAPGGQHPLGIEIDPTLDYETRDGLLVALDYGVLFPLSGLDNPVAHLNAQPAELVRLRLMYRF